MMLRIEYRKKNCSCYAIIKVCGFRVNRHLKCPQLVLSYFSAADSFDQLLDCVDDTPLGELEGKAMGWSGLLHVARHSFFLFMMH